MKEVKVRKIRYLNRNVGKYIRTEKHREILRRIGIEKFLKNHPMKNPESRRKCVETKRRKYKEWPSVKFQKGNQFGKLRKNKKISKKQKDLMSAQKIGKEQPQLKPFQFKKGQAANNKKDLDKFKEEIIRLYREELWNSQEIGKKFGCSGKLIRRFLRENNALMKHSERIKKLMTIGKMRTTKGKNIRKDLDKNKEDIIAKYLINLITQTEIAKEFNCNPKTIYSRLKSWGVLMENPYGVRGISESRRALKSAILIGKEQPQLKPFQFKKGQAANNKKDLDKFKEEIIRLYREELWNSQEIGKKFGCSGVIISRRLKNWEKSMNISERLKLLNSHNKIASWSKRANGAQIKMKGGTNEDNSSCDLAMFFDGLGS